MAQTTGKIISGIIIGVVFLLAIGLSLLAVLKPAQADHAGLSNSVDVLATAEALQALHQQQELEATAQARSAEWETALSEKRSELAESERAWQRQILKMQTRLKELQQDIEQTRANLSQAQQQIDALQQAIEADQQAYQEDLAALNAAMKQVENDLESRINETSVALQAARAALDSRQSASPVLSSGDSSDDDSSSSANSGDEDKSDDSDDHKEDDD